MFEVRVESEFAAAHFLKDYNGKCENLHGHNYKVYVHVRGKELDKGGMLVDFAFLKAALNAVINSIDHTNLNDIEEFHQNPSAERIAMYIYNRLMDSLEYRGVDFSVKSPGARIVAVDVFETDRSRARYIPE